MSDSFFSYFAAVIGVFFGSFLLLIGDRLSRGATILGRSHCEACHHALAWYDLVPIFSFSLLGARCRYCSKKLSYMYPVSELVTGIVFGITWYISVQVYAGFVIHFVHVAIVGIFLAICFADIRYHIIPDELQVALFLLSLTRIVIMSGVVIDVFFWLVIKEYIISIITSTLPLLALFVLTQGKGMGFGDVKLALSIGLLANGMWGSLLVLYVAFIVGGIVGGVLLLSGSKKMKSKIAFGPFLLIGTYAVLFFELELLWFFSHWLLV